MKQELELKRFTLVDKKVQHLINKLNKLNDEYQFKVYLILKEILKLRQTQMKKYTINSLANEKEINIVAESIQYIFGFDYLTKTTAQLIKDKKLKASTYLHIIRRSTELKKPLAQNKIIKDYVDGKITSTEISHIPMKALIHKTRQNYNKESVLIGTKIIYRIENIKAYLKSNKKLLINKEINKSIKRVAKQLQKVTRRLKWNTNVQEKNVDGNGKQE